MLITFGILQWLYMLNVAHLGLSWSNAASFDPVLCAELALKLALVLECKATTNESLKSGGMNEVDVMSPADTLVEHLDTKEVSCHSYRLNT